LSIHKVVPEGGAVNATTCRRKGDNTYILLYVHFVGVLKDIYDKMHRMESCKMTGHETVSVRLA
jgi:hypothetical protein